jgi:hypothetical protein
VEGSIGELVDQEDFYDEEEETREYRVRPVN